MLACIADVPESTDWIALALASTLLIVVWLAVHHFVRGAVAVDEDFGVLFQAAFVSLPWSWLAAFVALVLRARLRIGAWPEPMRIEPRWTIGGGSIDPGEFPVHVLLLWLGAIAVVLSLAAFAPTAWVALRARTPRSKSLTCAYALGLVAFVVLWKVDPGGLVSWFIG